MNRLMEVCFEKPSDIAKVSADIVRNADDAVTAWLDARDAACAEYGYTSYEHARLVWADSKQKKAQRIHAQDVMAKSRRLPLERAKDAALTELRKAIRLATPVVFDNSNDRGSGFGMNTED